MIIPIVIVCPESSENKQFPFFSVRILHDHQSKIQNLEFSNKKLPFYLFESSDDIQLDKLGSIARTCNPSKWEADI